MTIELAEDCTKIEVSICQGFGLIDFELELECLNEVGQGCAGFTCSAVVTSQIVESGRLKLE